MSRLDHLMRMIYHEKQQSGSMLCAQHALNNLLQGNYFTAPDLSEIARNLDSLEQSYDNNNTGANSSNMDDTGFFSVQVLENALSVWGLSLIRWRGEEMRAYQDHPHTQQAFILNYQEHWYTLRRFGLDDNNGHWFDLNSLLPAPKWVGRLYLGMVLQQAEADGYSVFVIRPASPSSSLPRTEVDEIAATISEDGLQDAGQDPSNSQAGGSSDVEGLEDEDWELQAALHASLGGSVAEAPVQPPHLVRRPIPLPDSGPSSGGASGDLTPAQQHSSSSLPDPSDDAAVLAAASRERGRRMLEQMTAEQYQAQQELWRDGNRPVRRDEDEEYEEMLRRVMAESEALAKAADERQKREGSDDSGSDMNVDVSSTPQLPTFQREHVYDDDDAELQAALKASLEGLPEGWTPLEQPTSTGSSSTTQPVKGMTDSASVASELSEDESEPPSDQPAQTVDHAEMRRLRLARFGG